MVEPRNIITIFFGKFESPYVGSPFMVGGNQIYSAIIRECGLSTIKDVVKVSHGIFHNTIKGSKDWKGWPVRNKANINEKTIKSYDDFFQLRSYHTPFIKDTMLNCEAGRIIKNNRFVLKCGDKIDAFNTDKLSFFIVSDHEVDLDTEYLQLGAKRNLGFGLLKITNSYSIDMDTLDYSVFKNNHKLIETAKSGITGIYNHTKYGYGEFKLEESESHKNLWFVKLSTPLCLDSTMDNSTHYEVPPSFIVYDNQCKKHREFIWRKGKPEPLYCISDGEVFLYAT